MDMERVPESSPNIFTQEQATVWTYDTGKSTGILYSLASSPGALTYSPDQIQGPADTNPKAMKSTSAIALITYPGLWYFYAAATGSGGEKENYLFVPCPPEAMELLLKLQGKVTAVADVNIVRQGGTVVAAGQALTGTIDEALVGLLARVLLTANDSGAAANARNMPLEQRAAVADQAYALRRLLTDSVQRGDDGTDYPAIAARGSAAQQATTLVRMLTDSVIKGNDPINADYRSAAMLEETSGLGIGGVALLQMRKAGYWSSRRGRRFRVTSEGTAITVSNGFTDTAPRFTIENGATNELIIRKIILRCLVAGTTNLQYRVVIDADARYSSGGTAVTLGARTNMNGGSAATAGFTAHYGAITATATDADEREIEYGTIVNATGNGVELNFDDGLIVAASGTLLLYLMDAGGVGTIAAAVELEEANIQ